LVFISNKWQRWQGEKITLRSEFMFRRQTNSPVHFLWPSRDASQNTCSISMHVCIHWYERMLPLRFISHHPFSLPRNEEKEKRDGTAAYQDYWRFIPRQSYDIIYVAPPVENACIFHSNYTHLEMSKKKEAKD